MKFTFLSFLFLAALVAFSSCKDEKKAESTPTTEAPAETAPAPAADAQSMPTPAETQAAPAGAQQAQALEPAQNAKGVWHYTCPKGCPGGAGAQGTCPKCGGPLQHNAGYHAQ